MNTGVLLTLLAGIFVQGSIATEHHKKLLHDLLNNYQKGVRPVRNESTVINVVVRITLHQIRELDEKNQFIVTNVWIRFFWRDEFLQWNPEDYGGITRMHVQSSLVWQPDIVLYNSVDQNALAKDFMSDTNVEVSPDGNMSWTAPALLKSSCMIKIQDYPFDKQTCKLKLGSWTYNGWEINISYFAPEILTDNYIPDGEWEILDAPCERNEVFYSCCPQPFPDVTCYLKLKRLPLFYMYNLVFPCCLLIIIGGLVFFLPPESGERVSLAVTLLLAMTVFMLVIMENIPETSETVPSLQEFIGGTIVLLTIATIISIIIVNFYHKGQSGKRIPTFLRNLMIKYIAKMFCVQIPDNLREVYQLDKHRKANNNETGMALLKNGRVESTDVIGEATNPEDTDLANASPDNVQNLLKVISDKLNIMREFVSGKEENAVQAEMIQAEWAVAASIINRLFLAVFCLASAIILAKILTQL
uniref:Acetylcholine receptor alpha-9/10 n=1 Tax=Platynereis dumerilii TaxID=6359 RepID=B6VAH5_PLADU|nr:acetylcholine receptor alpha-9/10 [Platynereis dumerilii]